MELSKKISQQVFGDDSPKPTKEVKLNPEIDTSAKTKSKKLDAPSSLPTPAETPILGKRKSSKPASIYDLAEKPSDDSYEVMLAENFNPEKTDPTGWLMSEKLDGVRCIWNGKDKLLSRTGKHYYPPAEFIAKLPQGIHLDGELWSDRDAFQSIVSTVRKHNPVAKEWEKIKFMVFDAPLTKGGFVKRLKVIEKTLAELCKDDGTATAIMVKQTVCKGHAHLQEFTQAIIDKKGEGAMVKEPNSAYEHKRSKNLQKVKQFEDAEATVVGHQPGTGRLKGLCGALLMQEKNGTKFKIGSGFTDDQRRKMPKVGTVVTFKFQGRSNAGVPRFPTFMREHPGF